MIIEIKIKVTRLKGNMGALPGVTNVLYLEFGNVYLGLCICTLKVHALCVNSH